MTTLPPEVFHIVAPLEGVGTYNFRVPEPPDGQSLIGATFNYRVFLECHAKSILTSPVFFNLRGKRYPWPPTAAVQLSGPHFHTYSYRKFAYIPAGALSVTKTISSGGDNLVGKNQWWTPDSVLDFKLTTLVTQHGGELIEWPTRHVLAIGIIEYEIEPT